MWDAVTPLEIGGKHVGNIFSSQFLFDDESPDRELFRAQARQYGFDESAYLAALDRVPRLSRETLTAGITYFTRLADIISKLSYSNIKLARFLSERDALTGTLRANEARLRLALDAAKSGTWEWDLETGKGAWSDEVWGLYGVEPHAFEPSHANWLAMVHPQDRAMAERITAEAANTASELSLEYRVAEADGEPRWLMVCGRPVRDAKGRLLRFAGIVMDITERKQAEQALIRSEKLASVGRMAATVAHEINNPLEAITNLVFIAYNDPSLSGRTRANLRLAQQELEQVAHLTRQTLGFYRENSTPGPVQLAELVDEVLELYARKLKYKNIKVQREYGGKDRIFALAGEIRQVIANLVANSIDAVGEGGRMTIRVSLLPGAAKGNREKVRLTIADNGTGIDPEHRKHIFEPFFTTKQSVGTGLGLWVTSEIVKKHSGLIRVRSQKGRGTVFSVFFPAEDAGKSFAKRAGVSG
jgi:PAS domain S-box-containing protein